VPILDNIVGLGSGQYLPSNHMLPRVNKMPNPFVHDYTPGSPLKPVSDDIANNRPYPDNITMYEKSQSSYISMLNPTYKAVKRTSNIVERKSKYD
jgi:hypothetical protein